MRRTSTLSAVSLILLSLTAWWAPVGSRRAEAQVVSFPVEETSIVALKAAYRSGRATARAVTQAHLDRIAAYDKRGPLINAIITVNPKALDEADRLDAVLKSSGAFVGPLHGIPVIVKDNIDVAGLPMTPGFQGWKGGEPTTHPKTRRWSGRFVKLAPSFWRKAPCQSLREAPATTSTRQTSGCEISRSLQIFLARSLLISLWRGTLEDFLAARFT